MRIGRIRARTMRASRTGQCCRFRLPMRRRQASHRLRRQPFRNSPISLLRARTVRGARAISTAALARAPSDVVDALRNFVEIVLLAVAALLPIVDPLGGAPIYLALTRGVDRAARD